LLKAVQHQYIWQSYKQNYDVRRALNLGKEGIKKQLLLSKFIP